MSEFDDHPAHRRYKPSAVLKVTGADSFAFLQGQFTQDLRPTQHKAVVAYGLWLNQKGKVLADSFVLRRGEEWLCVSPFSPAATIRERLEAFVVADDVVIEDVTAFWSGVTIFGRGASDYVKNNLPSGEENAGGLITTDGGFLFPGRRALTPSWEWLYPEGGYDSRMQFNDEIGFPESERLRIEALIPSIPQDVGPEDLPAEGGLDHDAISYTKGCYLGQEVMARLKSMGRVRRRLMKVAGRRAQALELPSPLFADGKRVGELRSVAPSGEGFVGLAMLSLLGLGDHRLLALSPDGPPELAIIPPR